MCKAMSRSCFNVLLGGFGSDAAAASAGGSQQQRPVKSGSVDDATFLRGNAETGLIVPGYGRTVVDAQAALKELAEKLGHKGVTVYFPLLPDAGCMLVHMNMLPAEPKVPYA